MRNLLTSFLALSLASLFGCSTSPTEKAHRTSMLESLPFVYRMTVQQGNIITEKMVDALQTGMTKVQVRYLLGTPLLMDMFHTDRWDYTYTIRRGHNPMEIKRLTIWFQDDAVTRIDGDMQPDPQRAASRTDEPVVVSVPDWKDNRGLFSRAASRVGL